MDAGTMNLVFLAVFMAIFYFFFMRPSIKKQKSQDNFINNLSKGDQIVTTSGILGRITKIEEDGIVEIQVDNKSFLRVVKTAISRENTDALYGEKK